MKTVSPRSNYRVNVALLSAHGQSRNLSKGGDVEMICTAHRITSRGSMGGNNARRRQRHEHATTQNAKEHMQNRERARRPRRLPLFSHSLSPLATSPPAPLQKNAHANPKIKKNKECTSLSNTDTQITHTHIYIYRARREC
jgi:hypothetical protein